jgi:hypothetical protein
LTPNDDLTPNVNLIDNTKELFNQDLEENQEVEPALNKKLFLASMNNSTRDESINDGPFNSSDLTEPTNPFRTANNNEISTSEISLIPKKRNIPSALKKFQSQTTINQPSTITPLSNKRHTSNKQDKTEILSTPIRQNSVDDSNHKSDLNNHGKPPTNLNSEPNQQRLRNPATEDYNSDDVNLITKLLQDHQKYQNQLEKDESPNYHNRMTHNLNKRNIRNPCEYTYILGALTKIHSGTQEGSKQTRRDTARTLQAANQRPTVRSQTPALRREHRKRQRSKLSATRAHDH